MSQSYDTDKGEIPRPAGKSAGLRDDARWRSRWHSAFGI